MSWSVSERVSEWEEKSVLVKEVIKKLNKNKKFTSIFIQMSENIAPPWLFDDAQYFLVFFEHSTCVSPNYFLLAIQKHLKTDLI